MATTEARMKQLTGAYADLNKSNMLVGEMAVPSDHVPVVRNGVNSWEDLLTSQSAGDIIELSETMTEQIDSFEQLVIDRVGINDSTATLTQAYSGSKTQGLIDTLNTNLSTKASQSALNTTNANVALKANQSDLSATNAIVTQKADKSEVTNVITPKGNLAYASLPTTGNTVGWYYYCTDGDGTHGAGNYVWNGTAWYFGGTGDEGYSILNKKTDDISEAESYKNILEEIVLYPNTHLQQYTGITDSMAGWTTTDYIPFVNGQNMHFFDSKPATALILWSVYDANKAFVAGDFISLSDYKGNLQWDYISHSFLRLSYESYETVKAYYGTTPIINKYAIKYDAIPLRIRNKLTDYVVDKNGNGDFTTVTEACDAVPEGSIIRIKPGIYDNEVITGTWSKKLYLIGESKLDCIIKNNKGDYNYPPIQIGAGYLKNLTFYSENDGTPSQAAGSTGAYGVHVESDNLYNGNLTIDNCIMKSDWASGFGMGMRGGCNVLLNQCDIISTLVFAMLFHDADNDNFKGIQNISIRDCILHATAPDSKALVIQSQSKAGTTVNIEMLRNRLKCTDAIPHRGFNWYGGTGGEDDFLGAINFRLKETSWGNSDSVFNVL